MAETPNDQNATARTRRTWTGTGVGFAGMMALVVAVGLACGQKQDTAPQAQQQAARPAAEPAGDVVEPSGGPAPESAPVVQPEPAPEPEPEPAFEPEPEPAPEPEPVVVPSIPEPAPEPLPDPVTAAQEEAARQAAEQAQAALAEAERKAAAAQAEAERAATYARELAQAEAALQQGDREAALAALGAAVAVGGETAAVGELRAQIDQMQVPPAPPATQPSPAPPVDHTPEPTAPAPPAVTGFAYQGSGSCKKCHFAQHKSWMATTMALSFDNLKAGERADAKVAAGLDPQADYTTDATCLPCHTTGYGQPGGFVSIDATPDLAGVGCEACHGPGESYLEIMTAKYKDHPIKEMTDRGLIYPPNEVHCGTCHNDTSPFNASVDAKYAFDFAERVQGDGGSHEHRPLKGVHPDLGELGALFQE